MRELGQPGLALARAQLVTQQSAELGSAGVLLNARAVWEMAEALIALDRGPDGKPLIEHIKTFVEANGAVLPDTPLRWMLNETQVLSFKWTLSFTRVEMIQAFVEALWTSAEPVRAYWRTSLLRAALQLVRKGHPLRRVSVDVYACIQRLNEGAVADAVTHAQLEVLGQLIELTDPEHDELVLDDVEWASLLPDSSTLALAVDGSADACAEIGASFGAGHGVARNARYALHWYERAIGLGSGVAACAAAGMYRRGEGVDKNPEKAAELLQLAATRGVVQAMTNFAHCLVRGDGVAADPVAARHWAARAHEQGDALGTILLAALFENGLGGGRDPRGARTLLEPLAARGDAGAMMALRRLVAESASDG
jgi:hypothetical protein